MRFLTSLGTGNDLARSLGWGGSFDKRWTKEFSAMYKTLRRVAEAEALTMDCWQVSLARSNDEKEEWFQELPHAFEAKENEPGVQVGYSWNYVSVGMDAYAAYGFHHVRETKPWLAANRLMNQFWYGYYGVFGGWGCCTTPVGATAVLKVQDSSTQQGEWRQVELPKEVKAIVLLNVQSYAGGKNIWGKAYKAKDKKRGYQKPNWDDGLIEVVGLKGLWHTGMVLAGLTHGKRVAQGHAIRVELKGSENSDPGKVYMQLDGEPWVQKIPSKDSVSPFVVELHHAGKSRMLMNHLPLNGEELPLHEQVRPKQQQNQRGNKIPTEITKQKELQMEDIKQRENDIVSDNQV
eukprot:TRINITY_DN18754_c0_g2_i3.p1 TRINITY_DN18754_c0_g2~~TRINITY_DN18754_c0_g2_i3.p1  ORF type:complete len:348 (+),score=50.19 TRINITY_DN18754_c0_g2_i3:49-1092(+)